MNREGDSERIRELELMEAIEENPETRQADLATQLDIAVGTVNWIIKRLSKKGYIKVKRIGQWKWRYILTPRGFAEKARLTRRYIQDSMELYRRTRQSAQQLLTKLRKKGYDSVQLKGDPGNDLVDVCRLTCLEKGIKVSEAKLDNPAGGPDQAPIIEIKGRDLSLKWPEEKISVVS